MKLPMNFTKIWTNNMSKEVRDYYRLFLGGAKFKNASGDGWVMFAKSDLIYTWISDEPSIVAKYNTLTWWDRFEFKAPRCLNAMIGAVCYWSYYHWREDNE
jgi:DNA-binding transcriptional regulator/RsmH inhibitor MraZ